ncbi:PocR ligand-binding domain-containing protein [Pseudodesulfovibrio tunisiensis]|uniref:PocR ligand-binding domain-containing protein n=1 Tax=Pseudodesulfovibrio tunisiensis TaxID=463192 RepID=UPI001FB4D3AC|nr:PocR ligand-binding domain-containing protein [Pseudodesulfovibrio tunisiensis]
MKMTDLAPEQDWKALQQELRDTYGFNADIMDAEGRRLFGSSWGNDLCRAIHDDRQAFGAICQPSGQMFTHLLTSGRTAFAEECDGGMLRITVPVIRNNELVGAVGGCGLLPDDGEIEEFMIRMSSGMDEATIAKHAGTVAPVQRARVDEIIARIERRIREITAEA